MTNNVLQGELFDKPKPQEAKDLFRRGRILHNEILVLKEDLRTLADEFTYDKELNKLGLTKKIVKSTLKAAEVDAGNSFEKLVDKRMEQEEFEEYFKEISGYDD
jgi:hypothetical protein